MRLQLTILSALCFSLAGCAIETQRSSLGYGDYVALNCEQLGQEAVRLMREASDRSEYFLQNNEDRRQKARQQLSLVKQASAEKGCHAVNPGKPHV
jgi:hypothetical protein